MGVKRILAVILVAVMTLNLFPIPPTVEAAGASHTEYSLCTEPDPVTTTSTKTLDDKFTEIQSQLPGGTTKTVKGQYLNFKLWHDKHIVVYGNYSILPKNDFNTATQPTGTTTKLENQGYYRNDKDLLGEYRYHGLDVAGNPYSNINFPNDANKSGDKNWLQQPWQNVKMKELISASEYDYRAADGNIQTQQWINSMFDGWKIKYGYAANGDSVSFLNGVPDSYSYVHVMTAPGLMHTGEGRMWHKDNGSVWYQTFTIPRLVNKQSTPVDLQMTLLSTPAELTSVDTEDAAASNVEILVKMKLTATLKDEAFYLEEVEKVNRYTREDIKNWTMTVDGETLKDVNFHDNIATKEFTKKYTLAEVKAMFSSHTFSGTATVTFND